MAAVSLISGSIFGWLAAAVAVFAGATGVAAAMIYIAVSLAFATFIVTAATLRMDR
ncbi:hypothetical protein [Marivita hallyeonensis]|uniref:Uncharacterized protein n=1 Tax=Marivita hallyeonensis TaxID=996342 RepID=A0A1M5MVH5_9RHOB|nr:hypothetical protein [Marivita hallyeonensis]SHG81281.1 hypothetical protein SAMN05443551_0669 [Marivita hallyeonensis]